jgi:broad specificity phosphatase PhoE
MIFLVRHGQSEANRDGLLVGHLDVSLTSVGEAQARELDGNLGHVVMAMSSPLERARRTGELAVPSAKIDIDNAFIEMNYGELEGQPLKEVGATTWRALQDDHEWRIPGGESMADVDERVHDRLDSLLREHADVVASPHENIVIFSHVSPIKSAVAWALGIHGGSAWRMRLDNATITAIGAVAGRPSLLRYNSRP